MNQAGIESTLTRVVRVLASGKKLKGWCRYKSKHRTHAAFYNKKHGIVVKCPAWIMEPATPSHLRIPTIEIGDDGWIAQPIARKTDLKAACDSIRRRLKKHPEIFPDVHTGNVGWYRGKAYLFDW